MPRATPEQSLKVLHAEVIMRRRIDLKASFGQQAHRNLKKHCKSFVQNDDTFMAGRRA